MTLMNHTDVAIKCEATWVICNAITCSTARVHVIIVGDSLAYILTKLLEELPELGELNLAVNVI